MPKFVPLPELYSYYLPDQKIAHLEYYGCRFYDEEMFFIFVDWMEDVISLFLHFPTGAVDYQNLEIEFNKILGT